MPSLRRSGEASCACAHCLTFTQGGGLAAANARVYAVKVGLLSCFICILPERALQVNHNCLLDVARETYKENVADIFQLNRSLSESHSLPLQLVHQEQGFVFTLRKTDLEEAGMAELPKGFVNVTERKGKWFFESIDLVSASRIWYRFIVSYPLS